MVYYGRIVVEHLVLPVRTRGDGAPHGVGKIVGVGVGSLHAGVGVPLVHHHGVLRSVEEVALAPLALPSVREVVVDPHLALRAALGGDQHHAVGRTRTVDCARGGVLEHLDTLDVARVYVVEAALDGHSVDDVERVGVVDGADTAHADFRRRSRLSRRRRYGDACGEALQGVVHADGCRHAQLVRAYLGYGGRHDALLLHAVTHHYKLVERGVVLVHDDAHACRGLGLDRLVPYVRYGYRTAFGHLCQLERSVKVGDCALCASFLED